MRFHKTLTAAILAARIEHRWRRILQLRKQGNKLLSRGEPLTSHRLLRLNRRIDHCGRLAATQAKYYETHYIN